MPKMYITHTVNPFDTQAGAPYDISQSEYTVVDIPVVSYTGAVADFPGASDYLSSYFPLVQDEDGNEVWTAGFISLKPDQSISEMDSFIQIHFSPNKSFAYSICYDGVWGDNSSTIAVHPWTILYSLANSCYGYIAWNDRDEEWMAGLFATNGVMQENPERVKTLYDFIEANSGNDSAENKRRDPLSVWVGYKLGSMIAGQRTMRTPVAFLYNGVRLPGINSVYTPELQKTHPYAAIVYYRAFMIERYSVIMSPAPIVIITDDQARNWYRAYPPSLVSYMSISQSETEWRDIEEYSADIRDSMIVHEQTGLTYFDDIIWSNHDVLNADNTVYLATTAPVPVPVYE